MALLAAIPLAYLVLRAAGGLDASLDLVLRPRTARVLLDTLALALTVGIGAALVGVPVGWLTSVTDLPGRRWWSILLLVPLAIPSYVLAFAVIAAFGPSGVLGDALEPLGIRIPSLYGFPVAALVLVLSTYPYVALAVRAAIRRLDASMLDAARLLGDPPRRAFRRVVLPALVPAISAGMLLAVLYALADFGSVSLLQFDSFARAIHVQYRAAFDRSLAAILALMLAALALTVAVAEARVRRRQPRTVAGPAWRPFPIQPLGRWRWPAIAGCTAVAGLSLVLPIVVLVGWLGRGLGTGEALRILPEATLNTVLAASAAAVAALLLAAPVAVLVARWPGRVAAAVEIASVAAYALPGIVVALAVVFLASGVAPALYQTFPLLTLAYAVRFLPEAVGPLRDGLARVSPRLEESARLLGRSPAAAFREVAVPLLRPAAVGAAALVFLTTAKELPMTLLLGPTGFGTLATAVWSTVGEGQYARAAAPGLVLILVSVAGLGVILRGEGRGTR